PAPDRPSIATSRAFPARGGRVRDASARDFTVSESNRSPPVFSWTTASSEGLPLAPSPSPGLAWRRASTVAWDGAPLLLGAPPARWGAPGCCRCSGSAWPVPGRPVVRPVLLADCACYYPAFRVTQHPALAPAGSSGKPGARPVPRSLLPTPGCSLDRAAARRGQYLRRLRQYGSQNRLFCVSW